MSIIDRNCIFFEGPLTANATGNAVALTGLKIPGRMEPMPLRLSVTEAFLPAETQGLTITMEESDSADGPWAAVPGATVSVANPAEAPGLALGARPYLRFFAAGRAPQLAAPFVCRHACGGQNREQGAHLCRPHPRGRPALRTRHHGGLTPAGRPCTAPLYCSNFRGARPPEGSRPSPSPQELP